jgi:hypothetical protein
LVKLDRARAGLVAAFGTSGVSPHTVAVNSRLSYLADDLSGAPVRAGALAAIVALVLGCGGPIPIHVDEGVPTADAQVTDAGRVDGDIPADLGPDSAPPDVGPSIILEVGYGTTAEFMLAPGAGVATAVFGIQGGYHMDMGFRVRGLSAGDFNSGEWIIAYQLRTTAGHVLSEPITRVLSLVGVSFDGVGQVRSGDRVFFISNDPSAFDNAAITLEVTLTRGAQVVVSAVDMTLSVP